MVMRAVSVAVDAYAAIRFWCYDREWKLMAILILIFGFLNLPVVAEGERPQDVRGWGSVRWRMTETQVLTAFKGAATRPAKPVIYPDGGRASVELSQAEMGGLRWPAQFVFSGRPRGLNELIFGNPDEHRMSAGDMLESYGRVLGQLTARYGEPEKIQINPAEQTTRTASWIFPSTVILLATGGEKGLYGFHVEIFRRKGCKWDFCSGK